MVDNSFIFNNTDSVKEKGGQNSFNIMVTDTVKDVLKNSFAKYMNEEKIFDSIEISFHYPRPLYLYKEAIGQKELPLTEEQITEVCSRTESDILLSLDYINIQINPSDLQPFGVAKGNIETTMRVYSYNDNIVAIPIKLKQGFNISVDLGEEKSILPRLKALFAENAQWMADMAVYYFIPRWESQERRYYTRTINPSSHIAGVMKKGEWKKTANMWEQTYNKEKSWKKKARWASNVALSYEYADDLESASKWINLAYDLFPRGDKGRLAQDISNYRDKLTQRINDAPLLIIQLKTEQDGSIFNSENILSE
ncbi:MAG: DUF6340 family protein [Dysgonomonas sp.]